MENESKNQKSVAALREEKILEFWREQDIFKKSIEKPETKGEFVFYEGPPTANAKPALHHLEARAFKDVMPRYKTMQGFHVRRKAGWDTHGLPVELQIEKKLGLTSKKDIEAYGVAKFNKECKDSVHEYIGLWKTFTERMGYWVDFDDAYYTYDADYIESLWNVISKVNDRGLVYKDYKVVPWCPRCGTALSSHELAQGYQDDKDLSVYVKFKIVGVESGYFLAWTTTPWTLPGNVGLAVGKDIDYLEVKVGNEVLVIAKERLELITEPHEIIAEHKGSEMAGMQYEPLYPYLANQISGPEKEKLPSAYKVYLADFVTTDDGTGIVHTAVMYGQEDFELGTKVGLPKFHTVDEAGHFIKGTDFLEGRFVKDEEVAVDIIKDLAHRGLLFKKEKYEHSYPHCWRCKTPLIYYARDSWYIGMSKLQKELSAENESINWEPAHIQEGRFGEWLREIKDWAISRERYWGTPLPIWQAEDGERLFVDSFETLKKYTKKSGNQYFVMRHGEAEHNLGGFISEVADAPDHLTDKGKEQVRASAEKLKGEKIDLIIASPFVRTEETTEIVREVLGLTKDAVITDDRLHEFKIGGAGFKTWHEYHEKLPKTVENFTYAFSDGESYMSVKARIMQALYELEEKYQGKNILLVTHGAPAWLVVAGAHGYEPAKSLSMIAEKKDFHYLGNAEFQKLDFVPLPHNENYELDPHRPYIDEVVLEKDGKKFTRIKEVMDVWFDSGAMPFAQDHYPFQNKDWVEGAGYPADFISEAIDQTRGWFYTLHAVGTLMGRGKAYKNVICLGHLLDAKGKKMSKSIGNIVEPFEQMEKFGADTIRLWMYSVNQPGESKNYDEKVVAELHNKVFNLLYNVISFYELYRDKGLENTDSVESKNILDAWILARISELTKVMTHSLDNYKLMEPVRAMREFIDDLSTWYLRRSRDRIKDGDKEAKQTLYIVLKTIAKLLAPFAPFAAEDVWLKLKNEKDEESVHLAKWPEGKQDDVTTNMQIAKMNIVKDICTRGNAERKKHNIPVRQPLLKITVLGPAIESAYEELIKAELNIKNIEYSMEVDVLNLYTEITPELKLEGDYRELVRAVQELRKTGGLTPSDRVSITIAPEAESLLAPFMEDFKKTVLADSVNFADNDGAEVKAGEKMYKVTIKK